LEIPNDGGTKWPDFTEVENFKGERHQPNW
jgi:hypothetical protein